MLDINKVYYYIFQCPEDIFHVVERQGSGRTCLDSQSQASPPVTFMWKNNYFSLKNKQSEIQTSLTLALIPVSVLDQNQGIHLLNDSFQARDTNVYGSDRSVDKKHPKSFKLDKTLYFSYKYQLF